MGNNWYSNIHMTFSVEKMKSLMGILSSDHNFDIRRRGFSVY